MFTCRLAELTTNNCPTAPKSSTLEHFCSFSKVLSFKHGDIGRHPSVLMKIYYLSHFTWPAELSKNCLCLESAATVTRLWTGSHPISTGATRLSRACSLLAVWVMWALSQLPSDSGGENPVVWRESWLPYELCSPGLPQDEEPPLHVCFQARSVGFFKAGT